MVLKDYDLITGDCILTYSGSWLSRTIFWFSKWREYDKTRAKISHAAIFLHYDEKGRPMIAEANEKVELKSGAKYNNKRFIIHVARPNFKMTSSRCAALEAYMKAKEGEGYAYIQIMAHALKKLFGLNRTGDWDKDAVICSEVYCEAFEDLFGYKVVPGKLAADVNPLEIYESPNMTKVSPRS
jgi:hypothetical protein